MQGSFAFITLLSAIVVSAAPHNGAGLVKRQSDDVMESAGASGSVPTATSMPSGAPDGVFPTLSLGTGYAAGTGMPSGTGRPSATGTSTGGSCSKEGEITCGEDGYTWSMCGSGMISYDMGPVAAGMMCVDGEMVGDSNYAMPTAMPSGGGGGPGGRGSGGLGLGDYAARR